MAPHRQGSSSIISSLEFDKEGSLFATAGVSKRIRWAALRGCGPVVGWMGAASVRPVGAAWRQAARCAALC